MFNFISLASGSSGNCYYLYTERTGVLLDLGIGLRNLRKCFKEYGLSLSNVHYILVTHDHADHIKSVGSLSEKMDIPVYATRLVHSGIDKNYCVKHKVGNDKRRFVEKNAPFQLGDFSVTAFNVPHDSSENVGYVIRHKDTVFCLLTDVGHQTEEMQAVIQEADYLVIEANYDEGMLETGPYPAYLKARIKSGNGHLSNDMCAKMIAEWKSERLKRVWLCHISEENNTPALALSAVVNKLNEDLGAGKHIPQVEVLKRRSPMGIYELE